MLLRWISALIGIPLYLGLCLWGRLPFVISVTLLAAIGLSELLRAYRKQGLNPNPLLASLGLLVPLSVLLGEYVSYRHILAGACIAGFLGILWELSLAGRQLPVVEGTEGKEGIHLAQNLAYGLLCGLYVAMFGGLTWLRKPTAYVQYGSLPHLSAGAAWVLLLTFCIWATDSFALFAGKAFGKRLLAPKLSPKKTVAGSMGGLTASILFGGLFGWLLMGEVTIGLGVGALSGFFGQIGDLFESALKREAGVKDFGGIMPGHGGVLDRFDSLIFASSLLAIALWSCGRL